MNVNLIPITAHPSAAVITRARLIVAGGGVAITARCEQGCHAKVRGHDEPTYEVTIMPAGAICSCAAMRLCAHIGAAAYAATDVVKTACMPDGEQRCCVCARDLEPQALAFERLLDRMNRS